MAPDGEDWRGLEPASLLVNLVPDLWRTARAAWPLLVAVFVGGGVGNVVDLVLLAVFFGLAVGRTVTHFLTLRYRMHAGKLEIQSGLLARRSRVIDPARIQNVEIVQNVFHKAAGLVELRIETAGESGVEGLLSALSVAEANALREALHAPARPDESVAVPGGAPAGSPPAEEVLAIRLAELIGYGVSTGRVGAMVFAGWVVIETIGQLSSTAQQATSGLRPGAAFGLGLLALAVGYVLSVGGTVLRHYGFRLLRSPRGLRFEAGLLTRRGVEMPLNKVQLVRVDEPWLRRLMGYGTLSVETAATGIPGEPAAAEGVMPMVPTEEFADLTRVMLPALDVDPWATALSPAAPRALVRAVIAGIVRWGLGGAFLAWWFGPATLGLAAVGAVTGWLGWRRLGWHVSERFVVTRTGWMNRRTWILPRDKLQSVHLLAGPLLRSQGLAQVMVWVAGSSVVLPALKSEDAAAVFGALGEQAGRRRAEPVVPRGEGAGNGGAEAVVEAEPQSAPSSSVT